MKTRNRKMITHLQVIIPGDQVTMAVVLPVLPIPPRCCPFPNCYAPFPPSVKNQNGAFLWYVSLLWTRVTSANGLNYSSDCDRWSIAAESHSYAQIRHGQQDNWPILDFWPNTGDAQNDDVSNEEIELYHQVCIRRVTAKYVTQVLPARYQSGPAMQRLLKSLFPHQKYSISVSPNLSERFMCSKLLLIES